MFFGSGPDYAAINRARNLSDTLGQTTANLRQANRSIESLNESCTKRNVALIQASGYRMQVEAGRYAMHAQYKYLAKALISFDIHDPVAQDDVIEQILERAHRWAQVAYDQHLLDHFGLYIDDDDPDMYVHPDRYRMIQEDKIGLIDFEIYGKVPAKVNEVFLVSKKDITPSDFQSYNMLFRKGAEADAAIMGLG